MKWLYHKMGNCSVCDADSVRLYRPDPSDDVRLVMFEPICAHCKAKHEARGTR